MGDVQKQPDFVLRLEQLRDSNQWSIAEMARRAQLPKRSMENYFKGHKPGLDALLSMAKGFGVPVDFLVGNSDAPGTSHETLVYEAAYPVILGLVRRISLHVQGGQSVFQEGTVFALPIDKYADEEARDIARRFAKLAAFVERE